MSHAPTLTDNQREALEVVGASVALVSGAGCGKTTVLTERFLRHLEGRPLNELVALTFTDKAARELRQRVRAACRRRLEAGGDEAGRWRAALRGLEMAPIGTFHAFCQKLLTRFPIEAGVAPGFTVLDATVAPTLRARALDTCVRRWLSGPEPDADFVALAIDHGLGTVREHLATLSNGRPRDDLLSWAGRSAVEVVDLWREIWELDARPALLQEFVEEAGPCLELLETHASTHKTMKERQAFLLQNLGNLPETADPSSLLGEIVDQARVQGGGTKNDWPSIEIYDAVKTHLSTLRDSAKATLVALNWDEAASRTAAEDGVRLARLAVEVVDAYDQEKRATGALDFDDLLFRARDLLRRSDETLGEAAGTLAGALMVDEFQDTDAIQGEILEHLAGSNPNEGALFLVGDPKQSIYRFRGARPELFDEFRDRFPEAGRRKLSENFRGVPGLLGFVNALFARTFDDADLIAARPAPEGADDPPLTFLWAEEAAEEGSKGPSAHGRRVVEARWIARHLAGRIDRGDWIVRDPGTQNPRPATAGDVALLFRAMTDVAPYEKALADEGLDYHVVGGSAYYAQQEVIDLINLLSTVEDPTDASALAATLRSPFFGVSDDALYWLATAGAGDLPSNLRRWSEVEALPAVDRPKVERAAVCLDAWRAEKDRPPMAGWLDRVLAESGYEAALLGEYLGPRKRANVRKLVRQARKFDHQGGLTLADFVARLRADRLKTPREEQAATTEEEGTGVRLMSIHQAKGLEFPIVVVPDLARGPAPFTDGVGFHPALGPLVKPPAPDDPKVERDNGLGWTMFRQEETREEQAEALRLLYVATTRARDALILSAGVAADAKPNTPALGLLAQRFDRSTGQPIEAAPGVRATVVTRPPAETPNAPIADRIWPNLDAILEAIEGTGAVVDDPERPGDRARPSVVDLDPCRQDSGPGARADRLFRAALAELGAGRSDGAAGVFDHLGREQIPAASRRVRDEALARMASWRSSTLGRRVALAAEVAFDVPWAVSRPVGAVDATAYLGRVDLAFRDEAGGWQVVIFAEDTETAGTARLRAIGSALAAESLEFGPAERGWVVRFGESGAEVERVDLDPRAFDGEGF